MLSGPGACQSAPRRAHPAGTWVSGRAQFIRPHRADAGGSLDTLLPIFQLRKEHYDIDLEGFARYWFYGHKLMGYVLASFLIAGLAGLTK